MRDKFKDKASSWDDGSKKSNGSKKIADAISKTITLNKNMKIMDFGVGTGLLGFEILNFVKEVHGIDISPSMIDVLKEKNSKEKFIKPILQDIIEQPLKERYDGIISSMTLHHIENLDNFFETIYKVLNNGAFISIADLKTEDGTFHSNNDGVFHFGFKEDDLHSILQNAGFKNITYKIINTIKKSHKDFDIFLLTAFKS